jgi:DNA (cytosine-5)-methyltransferase 1
MDHRYKMQAKLKCLDLFCKQGGVSRGLADAGFEPVGVDINPQPLYPYTFIQADAMTCSLDGYDFYWASPPCQLFSNLKALARRHYDDLIEPIRSRLLATGKPFVIENVPGSPLRNPILLCVTMFGLKVKRHRLFECHPTIYPLLPPHACRGKAGFTNSTRGISAFKHKAKLICVTGHNFIVADARAAMGIDWMTHEGLREAIPPAMSRFIGELMIKQITTR